MRVSALRRLCRRASRPIGPCFASQAASLQPTGACESLFSPETVHSRHERLQRVLRRAEAAVGKISGVVQPTIKALLVDAAGTLIKPSEPAASVYLRYAEPHGCVLSEDQILRNFRKAFNEPWTESALRYEGEARAFWRRIVRQATGCDQPELHDAVYEYFGRAEAWTVDPGAEEALLDLRDAADQPPFVIELYIWHRIRSRTSGFRLAVVSNFDTRLRPLLDSLRLTRLFDEVVVSAEVGAEKPNPVIFEAACMRLGVDPAETLVVGDDRRNDVSGGRDAGCSAWLYGVDVKDFGEVVKRLRSGQIF